MKLNQKCECIEPVGGANSEEAQFDSVNQSYRRGEWLSFSGENAKYKWVSIIR